MIHPKYTTTILAVLTIIPCASAQPLDVEHPFMLWTADDIAAVKQRIETEHLSQ